MSEQEAVSAERGPGRPSDYTDDLALLICNRLATGEPLAVICRDEGMPHRSTIYDWMKARPEFSRRFARAREEGFDALAAECLAIADDASGDRKTVGRDGEEREVCDTEFVQRAKLRIETRLKLLAKWDPKRYGDKIALTGGGDEDSPIRTVRRIERAIIDPPDRDAEGVSPAPPARQI